MTLLRLEQVAKRYEVGSEQVRAVDGVDLTLDGGEMLALHGPSGSGKTTLLMLVCGLLKPDEGSVLYGGRDLSSLTDSQLCDHLRVEIGFVHQTFELMPRVSALENACVKLLLSGVSPRRARSIARPWLERVGLAEHAQRTPEQLSGGERQRLAIARALVGDPRLLLADEPTAHLDRARSLETTSMLADTAAGQGTAVLLVTHDTEAAAVAHRSLDMRDGRLVQPHAEDDAQAWRAALERPVS